MPVRRRPSGAVSFGVAMTHRPPRLPSRRELLRRAACAAGALALPFPIRANETGPVMAALSNYMAAARERVVPPDVIEKACFHVLDTVAAMVSGSELVPGRAALTFARAEPGRPVAT